MQSLTLQTASIDLQADEDELVPDYLKSPRKTPLTLLGLKFFLKNAVNRQRLDMIDRWVETLPKQNYEPAPEFKFYQKGYNLGGKLGELSTVQGAILARVGEKVRAVARPDHFNRSFLFEGIPKVIGFMVHCYRDAPLEPILSLATKIINIIVSETKIGDPETLLAIYVIAGYIALKYMDEEYIRYKFKLLSSPGKIETLYQVIDMDQVNLLYQRFTEALDTEDRDSVIFSQQSLKNLEKDMLMICQYEIETLMQGTHCFRCCHEIPKDQQAKVTSIGDPQGITLAYCCTNCGAWF